MIYSNSPLVDYRRISPNRYVNRKHTIDRITPHCIVGQWDTKTIGDEFARESKRASCNYGIAKDGKVVLVVEEKDGSWCSSSEANDRRAVTIECASDATHPYAFNITVYNKLIELCADICHRNGKTKLLWLGSKNKALNYTPKADEMILTVHRWFANKACPGDWLYSRLGDLAEKVNKELNTNITTKKEGEEVVESIKAIVNGKEIKADAITKDGRTFINIRSLESAGFSVGYIAQTKMRVLDNKKESICLILRDKDSGDYLREGKIDAININGHNYMPVRDVCAVLGSTDIKYDGERKEIIVNN